MLPLTIFYFIISGYILHMCIGKFFNPRAACYRLVYRRSNVRLQAYAETAKTPGCIAIRAFLAFFYRDRLPG